MTNKTDQIIIDRVEKSIAEFYSAMQLREELSLRIGKRTTYITRFTMISALAFGLVLFYLVSTLSSQVKTMHHQMVLMTEYMGSMQANMQVMPSINHHMANMQGNTASMDQRMAQMSDNIGAMNQQFAQINQSVGRMNYDVNRMAKPLSRIPFFSW